MGKYFNPYDLIFQDKESTSLDSANIKKLKKRILADLDLSDNGHIEINGKAIDKAECLRIFDELDHPDKNEFYIQLFSEKRLNEFLSHGDLSFFQNYRIEPLHKDTAFLEFIHPFFADMFLYVSKQCLRKNDSESFEKLLNIPLEFSDSQKHIIYSALDNHLIRYIDQIDKRTSKINQESSSETEAEKLISEVKSLFPSELLSKLPSYFQPTKNTIANSIRNLSVAIFNNLDDSSAALSLISYTSNVGPDGIVKSNLQKDLQQIESIHKERIEAEKYQPVLVRYSKKIIELKNLLDKIDNKQVGKQDIINKLNGFIDTEDLNSLPDLFNEVRNQFAAGVRSVSVSMWNTFQDINASISILSIAQKLRVSTEISNMIKNDMQQLRGMQAQIAAVNQQKADSKKENIGCIVTIIFAIVGAFIGGVWGFIIGGGIGHLIAKNI